MVRVLLYASDDKLKTISGQPRWLDRLDLGLAAGVPGATLTGGVRPRDPATLLQLVEEAERTVREDHAARPLVESATGRPPRLFSFEGPAGRVDEGGVYWVAGGWDGIGFLLAGSSDNAVATTVARPDYVLSPSADPVGTIRRLFESKGQSGDQSDSAIVYVWEAVLSTTRDAGGVESAPWVSGVAVYAGRIALDETHASTVASRLRVTSLLVGSPLWVEQV